MTQPPKHERLCDSCLSWLGSAAYFDQMSAEVIWESTWTRRRSTFSVIQARRSDNVNTHFLRHLIAFLQQDDPAMQLEQTWLRNHNQAVRALAEEAYVQMYYGHFSDAHRILQSAKDLARNKAMRLIFVSSK